MAMSGEGGAEALFDYYEILKEEDKEAAKQIAEKYKDAKNFLYLGRKYNYPIALEGALKLKEISYIHAEGYSAGEMKHGPIALIDENMPVFVIATKKGHSKLSSKQDNVRLHKLRSNVDAILVGKNTVLRDDPLLTVRYTRGKNPIRIILDSKGSISKKSKILQTSNEIPTIIAVSKKISKSNIDKLKKFPVEIITAGENSVNIKSLLKKLSNKKIKTILVEGGGTVNWEFVKHNLFDELIVTLSPFLIGGNNAISFIQGQGFEKISNSPNISLKSIKRLKNHLVLHYVKV